MSPTMTCPGRGASTAEVAESSGQTFRANHRLSPRGGLARGGRRGHRSHCPNRPAGGANRLEAGQKGPLVIGGMKKIRDQQNSIAAKKLKVFMIGLEGKGATKNSLTKRLRK